MSKVSGLLSITTADILGAGITAVFWFILAALMLPEEYGQIHYFMGIAGLAYGISLIGTSEVMTVYVAKKIQLQSTIVFLGLIVGGISAIIVGVIFSRIDVSFLLIAFIINDLSIGYLLGKKFFSQYSKHIIAQKSLTLVLGILFYFIVGPDGIIFGLALSYIHFIIVIFKIFKNSTINFPLFKQHASFVGNNYFISISGIVRSQIDKILIAPLIGFEILGNYALALQAYALLMVFSNIFYKYILPHDASGEKIKKIKYLTVSGSIGITIFGLTVLPIILPYIFPRFIESGIAIQIISIAVIPATIALLYTSKFLGMENSKMVLIGRILMAITIIVSLLILTPIYGISGAAGAFVISSIVNAIFLICAYQFKIKKPIWKL